MNNRLLTLGLITFLINLSCEAGSAKFAFQEGADFSAIKTYAWLPIMEDVFAGRKKMKARNPMNIQRIKTAIEAELTAKGMQQVDGSEAVVHVAFSGYLEDKVDIDEWDDRLTIGKGGFYTMNPVGIDNYTEGTLFIHFNDVKTGDLVWRGWVKRRVQGKVKEKLINKVVAQIMTNYPPMVRK